MAFFIGGCSTHAFGTGRPRLRRVSPNSSNKDFSKKSHLRTAKYFTASLRVISPLFSNHHPEYVLGSIHHYSEKGTSNGCNNDTNAAATANGSPHTNTPCGIRCNTYPTTGSNCTTYPSN